MLPVRRIQPFPRPSASGSRGMFVLFLFRLVAASCVSFARAQARGLTHFAAAPLPTQPAYTGPVRGTPPKRTREKGAHSAECPCLRRRAFRAKSGSPAGQRPAGERTSKEAGGVFAIPGRNGVLRTLRGRLPPGFPPPLSEGVTGRCGHRPLRVLTTAQRFFLSRLAYAQRAASRVLAKSAHLAPAFSQVSRRSLARPFPDKSACAGPCPGSLLGAGLRAAVRPCARPHSGPSALRITAQRFSFIHTFLYILSYCSGSGQPWR